MTIHYAGLRNVKTYSDRHGKPRAYYRRKGRSIALPVDGSKEECLAAYYAAAARLHTPGEIPTRTRSLSLRAVDFEVCVNRILQATKSRSIERVWEYNLTAAWLREEFARLKYKCEVTGLPFSPERTGNGRNPFAPSADRKDNTRGYTTDNVRLVLASVNIALSDWGDAHFDQMCRAYVAKSGGPL